MSGGGWFDWLPGFLNNSSPIMPPETFGPKAPVDPTGVMGMVPGDGTTPPVSQTSMAFTPGAQKGGWQNQLAQAMSRYRQAQQGGQQQPRSQRMTEWFGPRRIG